MLTVGTKVKCISVKKKYEHTCISLLSVKSTQPHFLTKQFRNTLKKKHFLNNWTVKYEEGMNF